MQQKCASLDMQPLGGKTWNQKSKKKCIDDLKLKSLMQDIIQLADVVQGEINDFEIAMILGEVSNLIQKCLRNRINEEKC
jgi:hypothetical protein